ncbi:hypothetical protein FACS1894184_04820 [Clostridia bacterium]|nr:hypothetical protein FACS1894184_04820 [Clostridia bacterium]
MERELCYALDWLPAAPEPPEPPIPPIPKYSACLNFHRMDIDTPLISEQFNL